MPVSGRKPNEGAPVRHRVKPVHEWTEVEAVPFQGPPLPGGRWSAKVLRWWKAISSMPHCVLWDESDWQFAMDSAEVAKRFYAGKMQAATELRNREKVMGTTVDFRRDLRIRYVDPKAELPEDIPSLEDYRKGIAE